MYVQFHLTRMHTHTHIKRNRCSIILISFSNVQYFTSALHCKSVFEQMFTQFCFFLSFDWHRIQCIWVWIFVCAFVFDNMMLSCSLKLAKQRKHTYNHTSKSHNFKIRTLKKIRAKTFLMCCSCLFFLLFYMSPWLLSFICGGDILLFFCTSFLILRRDVYLDLYRWRKEEKKKKKRKLLFVFVWF